MAMKRLVLLLALAALALGACAGAAVDEAGETDVEEAEESDAEEESEVVGEQSADSGYTCEDGSDPFAGVDPGFSPRFWPNTDFCQTTISYAEVVGVLRADQITPIDAPRFDAIDEANARIADQEPVIVFEENGDARAYPLSIMTWHEIANDVVGGRPVAVTYCPLCNAAIVFDRTVDGQELTFGTSGNLRNSDLIMWDRQTESWWQQFTGEAIAGEMAGTQLTFLPSQVTSWAEFKEAFPEGQALDTAGIRDYGRNPYAGYDTNAQPFLFRDANGFKEIDDRLFPVARVLGVTMGGEAVAYPFEALAEAGVVSDTVGGQDIVVFHQPGQVSALDGAAIAEGREVGSAAAFDPNLNGETLTFSSGGGAITDEQTGSRWNVFGQAVEGPLAGEELAPVLAYPHFWFAWAAFQPETEVYSLS